MPSACLEGILSCSSSQMSSSQTALGNNVKRRKSSASANDPETGNDPQTGPGANDPRCGPQMIHAGKRGMAWNLVPVHTYPNSF